MSSSGSIQGQHLLVQAMLDSWPRLAKNIAEMKRAARNAPWKSVPWSNRRDDPTTSAQKRADFIEDAMWGMVPTQQDVIRKRRGFEGMVELLVEGYYTGHQVIDLIYDDAGKLPKTASALSARFYGYPWEGEDRLMFDPSGMTGAQNFVDFPEHKVLIAINGSHSGNPVAAAPLRALTGYWLAATFGLKWFLSYAEKFGQPIRWAEYASGDEKAKAEIQTMMANIGANAWGVFPANTKLNMVESSKSASSIPSRELINLADEQCDIFILGQTLTSSVSKDGGSRALGDVHMDVRQDVIRGVCDFVGEVLSYQFVPSVCALNFSGDPTKDMPGIWAVWEEAKDEKAAAERVKILTEIGVPMAEKFVYDTLSVPIPGDGEKLFEVKKAEPNPTDVQTGRKPEEETEDLDEEERQQIEASDAAWTRFPANSGTLGIPRSEMPQIRSGDRASMVQFFRARGVESRSETVPARSLKPTQAEYSPDKVSTAKGWKGGNRSILVSKDGHVVDGHHQWKASEEDGSDIQIIRLMAPITRVLMMAHRMPSTKVAAADAVEPVKGDEAKELFKAMEDALEKGTLIDFKTIALMMSGAFVDGLAEDGKEGK